MKHLKWFYLCLMTLEISSGCGTFGGTSSFTLTDGLPSATNLEISVGSVDLENGASKTVAVGVIGFSGFDQVDQEHLTSSLRATLASMNQRSTTADRKANVYVCVRRYMVVASNNAAAVLACISWALVENRDLIFSEQFYGTSSGFNVRTVGGVKDDANKGIVRRIALRAGWASHPNSVSGEAPIVINTFDDFRSAVKELPKEFASTMLFVKRASENPDWGWVEVPEPIDWKAVLALKEIIASP